MTHPHLISRRSVSTLRLSVAALLLALLGAACITEGGRPKRAVPDNPWVEPGPRLMEQIQENAERMPWTHGQDRIQLIRWFAAIGEPAYMTMLELANDPRKAVAITALAALGATRDQRLVPSVQALPMHVSGSAEVKLERARTLMYLGDWGQAPILIEALESDDLTVRALAGFALYRATGESHDYDPRGTEEERAASATLWRDWWNRRQDEGILGDA